MRIYSYKNLSGKEIASLCRRNPVNDPAVAEAVKGIISRVKEEGDAALYELAERFDKVKLQRLFLEGAELQRLAGTLTTAEKQAIRTASRNIETFHQSQLRAEKKITTLPGVVCWREARAIERVGLYIPGGSAVLPSTFLMLAIPARLAGCREITVCSPPQKDGKVNRYIAYCASLLGIKKIYLAGGAQAVAAMAYGTETIPKTDKIFGPGNRYVTAAKSQVLADGAGAIDMPAGPSEVLVIADESCNPAFVAADLLSQAEHGADSQVVLVATKEKIVREVLRQLEEQVQKLDRRQIAKEALENSYAVVASSLRQAVEFSNRYAPEHLILSVKDPAALASSVQHAGSVFLGHYTPEAAGDYASGTNHTLPTSGFARAYAGVSVDTFLKKITFQQITKKGIQKLGPAIETLAAIEGLAAHREAVAIRLRSTDKKNAR